MMIHAPATPAQTETTAMDGMRGIAVRYVCGMESRIAKTVIRGTYNGGKMVGARNRDCSKRKALRKQKIAKMLYGEIIPGWEYYNNLHQYSKNKIHCSCPLCRVKSGDPGVGYKISDLRKIDRVSFVEQEISDEAVD